MSRSLKLVLPLALLIHCLLLMADMGNQRLHRRCKSFLGYVLNSTTHGFIPWLLFLDHFAVNLYRDSLVSLSTTQKYLVEQLDG